MLDYEEYYFGAEKGKIKYDYQKMGDMILDKKTDLMFWKQITVYELMDYACILCAYWDESMLETFRSEQNKTEIYDKVSDDLKMCYKVFCERYSKNSDAVAVFGYILEVYYFTIMVTQALTETVTDHDDTIIMDEGTKLQEQASKMGNPIAIAIRELDKKGTEVRVKVKEAIEYLKTHFPKESITVELLNYFFTSIENS